MPVKCSRAWRWKLCIVFAACNIALAAKARAWNTNVKQDHFLQVKPQPNQAKGKQTKKELTKVLAGSCVDQTNFEDVLDKLAYSLFVDPTQKASADGIPILHISDAISMPRSELPKAAADVKFMHSKLASARLQDWLDAVARTAAKRKHVFRATDPQNNSKPEPKNESKPKDNSSDDLDLSLPPACPDSVPYDDPYWSRQDSYWAPDSNGGYVAYNVCMYSDNCQRTFTNSQRIASLRATLYATHQFLIGRGATYMLFGGSTIGAFRCKDVLPWDLDQDVAVLQWDLDAVKELFMSGVSWNYSQTHEPAYIDLADHGIPGFTLMEKFQGCLPLAIVDQSTGFFVDLWPMAAYGGTVWSPWQAGKVECDAAGSFSGCAWTRCDTWSTGNTLPISGCQMHGAWHGCAHDLQRFLKEYYGSSVKKPNIPVRSVKKPDSPVRNGVDADKTKHDKSKHDKQ